MAAERKLHAFVIANNENEVRLMLEILPYPRRHARSKDCHPLQAAAAKGYPTMVQLLMDYGFHQDSTDGSEEQMTAMHHAAIHDQIPVLEILCKAGANVNAKTAKNGYTALRLAAMNDQEQAIKRLLHMGADPSIKDANGVTVLEWAHEHDIKGIANLIAKGKT